MSDLSQLQFTESEDWVSYHEKHWRKHLSQFVDKPAHALEIGTWEGRSAAWFLENILTDNSASLTTVDQKQFRIQRGNDKVLRRAYGAKINIIEAKALGWTASFLASDQKFDFIYLDGPKDAAEIWTLLGLCFEILRVGGILIIDDYAWPRNAVNKHDEPMLHFGNPIRISIGAFTTAYFDRLKVLHTDWQVIVQKAK